MTAGRPLKFQTVEELTAAIETYFASCKGDNGQWVRPLTITGLALALDTTRQTLLDYENKDEFTDTVRRAKLTVESYAEEQLFIGRNPSGAQFALKNHGWEDKSHQERSGSLTVHWPLGKSALDD